MQNPDEGHDERSSRALFSWTSTCKFDMSRARDREDNRIFSRQSWTQAHRGPRWSADSESDWADEAAADEWEIRARSRSRPRMGARERKVRNMSLKRTSGEVRTDDMVCGVGEGVDATVWRISPI